MPLYFTTDPIGFYDDAIWRTLPAGAQPMSVEERDALIAAQASGRRLVVRDGRIVAEEGAGGA